MCRSLGSLQLAIWLHVHDWLPQHVAHDRDHNVSQHACLERGIFGRMPSVIAEKAEKGYQSRRSLTGSYEGYYRHSKQGTILQAFPCSQGDCTGWR